jgi:hypothetical protein
MSIRKCINDFSAPSSANIRTSPKTNVGDGNFELKPTLINLVQQSSFCGKASEDANTQLQHFLGKAKQWFYAKKEAVSTWEKCSNAFLAKFFSLSKTNALRNKISSFQ